MPNAQPSALSGPITMWGTPNSLYTGKLRSYLIKKQLPFTELFASDPRFIGEIKEKVGHSVVPVVETPEGELIQDTTAIIDHCEAHYDGPALQPQGGVQQVVAAILDAFGSNYMLPLAMHYRWSYRDQQEDFIRAEFARAVPVALPYEQRLEIATKVMARFNGFLPNLGVTPEVIPEMEASYAELLAALEAHFRLYPYLLGGRPSIGDFGMMAPLYAHLARDPVPGLLMRTTAPNVARWTERMNTATIADPEYADQSESYPADDAIPATLEALLALVFAHWGPGLREDFTQFDCWLVKQECFNPGTLVSHDGRRQVHPHIGRITYQWRGLTMVRGSQPHALWHFARAQTLAAGLTAEAKARLDALLTRTGGGELMALTTARAIKRENNVLVLA